MKYTKTKNQIIYENFIMFIIGGHIYILFEKFFRGHSHWTMFFLGGLCFLLIDLLNEYIFEWDDSIINQAFTGAVIVTLLEFITGCIVNLWLGWDVWDYSNLPFNLFGQISLPFSILWFFVSILAIVVADWLRYFIFYEDKPHYKL